MDRTNLDALGAEILTGSPDGIVAADAAGATTFWNDAAGKIFGFTSDDAVGASLDLIIPENLRARHWEGYRRVMAGGETKYGDRLLATPALKKDGSRISIEFSIVLLHDEAGAPCGSAAIVRDVTARWKKERELASRVSELEAALRRQEEQP